MRLETALCLNAPVKFVLRPGIALCLLLVFSLPACRRVATETKPFPFLLVAPDAKNVFLAGSFNGWNTTSTPMQRNADGWWEKDLPLAPGRYRYKFIVDGNWMPDPANSDTEPDGLGGLNSRLTINPGANDDGPASKEALAAKARRLFLAGDFAAIEKEATQLWKTRAKAPDGVWRLAIYANGLNAMNYPEKDAKAWAEALQRYDAWHAQFPGSVFQPVARARAMVDYAWVARGTDVAARVEPAKWPTFEERLAAARQILEEAARLPERSPLWWLPMQDIALGQGWERSQYEALFSEAVTHEPTFYDYYYSKAYWLFPRWYGEPNEWEQFAATAPHEYDSAEGMALYARIVRSRAHFFGNIFQETAIRWPLLRQGYRDLRQQSPQSRWTLNQFCYFACLARDRSTAQQLFPQLGSDYNLELWERPALFAAWKKWADPATKSAAIEPVRSFQTRNPVALRALIFLDDGRKLLSGDDNGSLDIWDLANPDTPQQLAQLDHPVKGLARAPHAQTVAVATGVAANKSPGAVELVDLTDGGRTSVISGWHPSAFAVAFAPDGGALAAVGGEYHHPGATKIFSLTTKEVNDLPWPPLPFAATAIAFSPDGQLVAVNDNRKVRVWDRRQARLRFEAEPPLRLASSSVAFSPDGKWIVAAYSPDPEWSELEGGVVVWSSADGKLGQPPIRTPGGIYTLAFSPDGRFFAGAGYDESIYLWDTAHGELRQTFYPLNGFIFALTFSPDNRRLAAGTISGHITLWEIP